MSKVSLGALAFSLTPKLTLKLTLKSTWPIPTPFWLLEATNSNEFVSFVMEYQSSRGSRLLKLTYQLLSHLPHSRVDFGVDYKVIHETFQLSDIQVNSSYLELIQKTLGNLPTCQVDFKVVETWIFPVTWFTCCDDVTAATSLDWISRWRHDVTWPISCDVISPPRHFSWTGLNRII